MKRKLLSISKLFRLVPGDKFIVYWAKDDNPDHVRLNYEALLMVWLTDYVSLADVARAYPAGIDYRDWAWMFKRALEGLGFVHNRGVIHGAILPQNVMIHPTGHGAKLIDWCYSVALGERRSIPAYVIECKDYYPPEVFDKQFPTPGADIFMLAKTSVALLGGNVATGELPEAVPAEVRELLGRCLRERPSERPREAWDLHDEFDRVLEKLVGKPKYRPFSMPEAT